MKLVVSFIIYISSFLVLHFVIDDIEFSSLENRTLAQVGDDFETYFADQFPFRNTFIALKSSTELVLKKTDNNGVFIGDDGYFLDKFGEVDESLMYRNIDYISNFGQSLNTYLLIAPTSTLILQEKLPLYAPTFDELQFIDTYYEGVEGSVTTVDVVNTLKTNDSEYIYYKTDHHWTTLGAYYAYVEFCEAYGLEATSLGQMDRQVVSESFYGTLFSKGNFVFAEPDTVEIFTPIKPEGVTVTYVLDNIVTNSVYEMSHADEKDVYSIFFDNNHPLVIVETEVQTDNKLIILKDSYANCFIPFLLPHFSEIHILDLRFLNIRIADYAREQQIEDVLLLYNTNNFAVENKFSLLGQ
ncbi:MAG: hypothetical protein ATN35_10525 [Epulopiscium sp. Nele67-Bin004]|nr:MAG: hypothetical protein ATN35_10525 [Epulopiscium sp. Nele67-Bin004]